MITLKKAVYPGSFDPPTYGHLDIIKRASAVFDFLIVAIMENPNKATFFSPEEKKEMLDALCKDYENVKVVIGNGLTVDLAEYFNAKFLVRGIRAIVDYDYELQIASANMVIGKGIETIFFLARPEHSYLSSTITRSIAENHGDITKFVPKAVRQIVLDKYK